MEDKQDNGQFDELLSYQEAADEHRVPIQSIYRWAVLAKKTAGGKHNFKVRSTGWKKLSAEKLDEFIAAGLNNEERAYKGDEMKAEEAAQTLGISRGHLWRLIRRGDLPDTLWHATPGGYRRFSRKAVEAYAVDWDRKVKESNRLKGAMKQ